MISLKYLPYLISILSNILLAVFVLLRGRKERINQTFFATVMAANGWVISLFFYYYIEVPQYVLWIGRINFAMMFPMLYYLLDFATIFPREIISVPKKAKIGLALLFFLMTVLTIFTPLIAEEEIIVGPGQRKTVFGPLYTFYIINYFLLSSIVIALLFYKIRKFQKPTEKLQIKYVLLGLVLALFFGLITNIISPSLGLFDIANYGPLATIIFFLFVAAAIIRYHLFEIKVILTEVLVGIMGLILFVLPFLVDKFNLKILSWGIFILFCLLGYLLIRYTHKEISYRESLQKTYSKLKEATEDIEELSAMKSEFLKVVNHQLRTPVSIVKGMLSMMVEGSIKKERQKEFIKKAYLSSERLTTILDDILLAQSLVGGGEKIELSSCQMEEIIQRQVEHFKPQIEMKGLKIIFEKPKESLPITFADTEMIGRAIARLIDNAILYTDKGKIVVSAKLKEGGEKEFIEISVKDSGIGLSKAEKRNIFKLFYRGQKATSLHPNGSGLGLFIVKNLIEIHQGKMSVKSAGRGKGATFIITLPILTEV